MAKESGFSLLEILVATFVLSIVAAISVSLMAATMTAQSVNEDALERTANLDRLRVILREDIGQIARRTMRDEGGFTRRYIFAGANGGLSVAGETAEAGRLMAFTRHGRANPGAIRARSSLVFVEYILREDMIVRRTREYPDITSETLTAEQVLMRGVDDVQLEFWGGANWRESYFLAAVEAGGALPQAIRLRYTTERLGEIEHVVLGAEALSR